MSKKMPQFFSTVFILSLTLHVNAGELNQVSHLQATDPWGVLEQPDNVTTEQLGDAVATIIRLNKKDNLDRLLKSIESEAFLEGFAYPEPLTRFTDIDTHPFSRLMRQIAESKTPFAELLLIQLSESDLITGRFQRSTGRGNQKFYRGTAVIMAMGHMQPTLDATYDLLTKGSMGELNLHNTIALRSLVQIGNQRAADLVGNCLAEYFDDPYRLPVFLGEVGRQRLNPEIFGVLVRLAEKAPSAEIKLGILRTLVSSQSVSFDPHAPPIVFPAYQTLSAEKRSEMLRRVNSIDTKDFDSQSLKLLEQLKEMLTESKR